jgi:hypothetical protein
VSKEFKPLTVADFELSPKEVKTLVEGAQKFMAPADESGEPLPTDPEQNAD